MIFNARLLAWIWQFSLINCSNIIIYSCVRRGVSYSYPNNTAPWYTKRYQCKNFRDFDVAICSTEICQKFNGDSMDRNYVSVPIKRYIYRTSPFISNQNGVITIYVGHALVTVSCSCVFRPYNLDYLFWTTTKFTFFLLIFDLYCYLFICCYFFILEFCYTTLCNIFHAFHAQILLLFYDHILLFL